ncbi:hypothetical protein NDU88_001442 [Pleurodeles waltl]|uniref:Uncharacterized protein n=1 Tax=Pleurodeles waltl TaxID=8319 RepID=A0AAV7U6D7_PLEWA|nr:hypothetical protein NDU88_001442 [Pleurodeles waltl]
MAHQKPGSCTVVEAEAQRRRFSEDPSPRDKAPGREVGQSPSVDVLSGHRCWGRGEAQGLHSAAGAAA